MRVTFFGTYDEERHPRVRVLCQGLSLRGAEVTVVNRPLGDSTSDRVSAAHSPLHALKWAVGLVRAWTGLLRDSRRVGGPDAVIVGYLGVLDVFVARLRWPRSFIVLDHMAPLAGIAADRRLSNVVRLLFGLLDRAAEAVANLVVFDTEANAALSRSPEAKKLVVSVGAPEAWFELDPCDPPMGGAVEVIFVGLHTPLQGTPTIGEAIGRLAEAPIRFTMVGTGQELDACRTLAPSDADVTWIDWVSESELPALVARHHVCLGIFGTTPKARRVVPNKVYQGAAAGCAIVTLDSEAQRRALGDAAVYVPAGDAAALASALELLSQDAEYLAALRRRSKEAAASWRPVAVVAPLLDFLENRVR